MTRIVNVGAYERPVFASEGLGEWPLDEERDVRPGLAAQLLGRDDAAFVLADGETDPREVVEAPAEEVLAEAEPEPFSFSRSRRSAQSEVTTTTTDISEVTVTAPEGEPATE